MKYIDIKIIASKVRKRIKSTFPECKFSVRISRYSMGQSLNVALMQAPFDATTDRTGYVQVNHYALTGSDRRNTMLTEEAENVLRGVVEIIKEYHYDNSDPMVDYFDTNFYFNVDIGRWDAPFKKVLPNERR